MIVDFSLTQVVLGSLVSLLLLFAGKILQGLRTLLVMSAEGFEVQHGIYASSYRPTIAPTRMIVPTRNPPRYNRVRPQELPIEDETEP